MEEFPDQGTLGVDRPPLLHDQHGHQTVRDQEQNNQNRQPAMFLGWTRLNRRHWVRIRGPEFNLQDAPLSGSPLLTGTLGSASIEPMRRKKINIRKQVVYGAICKAFRRLQVQLNAHYEQAGFAFNYLPSTSLAMVASCMFEVPS